MSAVLAQSVLMSRTGDAVPLQAVSARGRLDGLLFELAVEQQYHNPSHEPIEAVFTFPLPLRAELLGFELQLGARHLRAVAKARAEASRVYEAAIDKGDSAVLLEHDGNGLYTVSLGNLMAGESAIIRYRYAELLDSHEGHVRLEVPTVIAPRYGNPADAGLAGPAIPGTNVLVEYPFSITLELPGIVDPKSVQSPSHAIQVAPTETGLSATLLRQGFLDKDFVIQIAAAALPQGALLSRDGEEWVLLASTALSLEKQESHSLSLKVLLDCSGSMGGASIAAARRALLAILDRLNGDDRIALTRFGSSVEQVTEGLERADAATLTPLKALVKRIDADLGGTEMEEGLRASLALPTHGAQNDILLITDGEIYAIEGVVELAARAGHRLFTIAIGAAPVEALARQLAERTGGGCEFVAPGEDVEGAILRTFKRLRSAPRSIASVSWPGTPAWVAPLPTAVFPGDTLHLMAGFKEKPAAGVGITVRDATGRNQMISQGLGAEVAGDRIPRLAAGRRLTQLPEAEARDLAVKYQLASPYTSLVVVAERNEDEKTGKLPNILTVPHMQVSDAFGMADAPRAFACAAPAGDVFESEVCESAPPPALACPPVRMARAYGDPARQVMDTQEPPGGQVEAEAMFDMGPFDATLLNVLSFRVAVGDSLPANLSDLEACGVEPHLIEALRQLATESGESEETLVRAFLAILAEALGAEQELLDALDRDVLQDRGHRELRRRLRGLVDSMGS